MLSKTTSGTCAIALVLAALAATGCGGAAAGGSSATTSSASSERVTGSTQTTQTTLQLDPAVAEWARKWKHKVGEADPVGGGEAGDQRTARGDRQLGGVLPPDGGIQRPFQLPTPARDEHGGHPGGDAAGAEDDEGRMPDDLRRHRSSHPGFERPERHRSKRRGAQGATRPGASHARRSRGRSGGDAAIAGAVPAREASPVRSREGIYSAPLAPRQSRVRDTDNRRTGRCLVRRFDLGGRQWNGDRGLCWRASSRRSRWCRAVNSSSSSSTNGRSTSGGGRPRKGGAFTILAKSSFGVADPAQGYTSEEWQLLIDTHDGLVQFKRVGGQAGTQLVPDLAESIPQPTEGGKTYTFQIRRRIRFSDGQVMKPSDFVRTFERQFTVPGPTTFYSGIVGAGQCTNATKTLKCDLTRGVVANDSNYTLTIHLTKPDPEFLDKLAMPFAYAVPGNTSLKLLGNNVPPGTGPYMWKSYNPNTSAVLVRNPYFHVWDAEARPPGNPNQIVQKYGLQTTDEVTQVENGGADEVFDGTVIPADPLTSSIAHATQLGCTSTPSRMTTTSP